MGQSEVDVHEPITSRSLLDWIPWLWGRVLFPGKITGTTQVRYTSILLLLAFPGLVLYPCMSFHLLEPDEGRYAEIPREMLQRGDWTVPYLQGEPYLDKPPMLYWLVMVSYRLFGVHDWSARLVPALAVHGCILLAYFVGRRSLGERAALWGALLLGVAPAFLGMGRLLVLDGLLTLWVTCSVLCGFEAVRGSRFGWPWWLVASLACGLGVLTKGPVAILLFLPPLWAHLWLTGKQGRIPWLGYGALLGVLLAVTLPWYIAIGLREPEFLRYFLWEHNVVRFLSPFDHLRPFWFYLPIVLFGLLPGSLLIGPFVRFLLSGEATAAGRRPPEIGFLLLAGGWCVLFFSLSGCKLPTYVLPAFPPLALALGGFVEIRRWHASRWAAAVLGMSVLLVGLANYVALPAYAKHRSPMGRPALVAPHCANREVPVICYPRNCDSVAFYLKRDDLQSYRSKQTPELLQYLQQQPRVVVLLSHRSSLETLQRVLPPDLVLKEVVPFLLAKDQSTSLPWSAVEKLVGDTPWGLCHLVIVERRATVP